MKYIITVKIEDETGRTTEVRHEPCERQRLERFPVVWPAVLAHEMAKSGGPL